jgi:hypothetical protein
MSLQDIALTLALFNAAAIAGGPVAGAIAAAFVAGVLIGRHQPDP